MAVTLTVAELLAALRLGDSAEEHAEVERLLTYATEAIEQHAPEATETAMNEAVRRLAGFLFDQPEAGRGDAYANALRNSGAQRMLLPYRIHRAGYTDAVASTQAAIGTVGNPVTGIDIVGGELVITFADGTVENLTSTPGMGGDGTDQTARELAAAAQAEIDDHEASIHNTDAVARNAASAAQSDIDGHEVSTHNQDITARTAATSAQTAADTAQADIDDHEANHPGGGGGGTDDQTAAEVPVTATSFTGNLGSGDTDVQTALDTIDSLSLGDGGGEAGEAPDRIVLADAVAVAATTSPSPIALTEDVVARQLLTFRMENSTAANTSPTFTILSDDFLALTATPASPSDNGNSIPVSVPRADLGTTGNAVGSIWVYRQDDSNLWIKSSRSFAYAVTLTATPLDGR